MRIESHLAQIGSVKEPVTGAISFPVYQATAFRHPKLGQSTGFDYARTKSPTRAVLEEAAAQLEAGDAAFACSSGMAALQTIFALFSQGDHLIVSLDLYGGTYRLLERIMSRFGVTASYVDTNDIDAMAALWTPNTKAVLIETPTNPLMMITDIEKVTAWAKSKGLLTIVDNTLLTPFLHNSIGAVLGPQDSWLLMRGMKTLALRMERHQYNATTIANYLLEHPAVEDVYYPALPHHPGHEVQNRQSSGNTGIFSFRLKDARYVEPILRHIKLIAFAESLGGVESLMTYPSVQTHADIPLEIRQAIGVDDRLLRFSVGIEHADDLISDLAQALEAAKREIEEVQ
jgi:cystathionine gamma-synthase